MTFLEFLTIIVLFLFVVYTVIIVDKMFKNFNSINDCEWDENKVNLLIDSNAIDYIDIYDLSYKILNEYDNINEIYLNIHYKSDIADREIYSLHNINNLSVIETHVYNKDISESLLVIAKHDKNIIPSTYGIIVISDKENNSPFKNPYILINSSDNTNSVFIKIKEIIDKELKKD